MQQFRSRLSQSVGRRTWLIIIVSMLAIGVAGVALMPRGAQATDTAASVAAKTDIGAISMPSTTGRNINMAQFHGSTTVVYFYEGAGCGPCQQQLIELQQSLPQIKKLGAQVVAATVDPIGMSTSLASQLKLGFPIVQDTDHRLGSAMNAYRLPSGMDMGPVDSHSIFILDPRGRIVWKELAPQTMHVSVDHILTALAR
jgi:peroxiredoxin Q/BCP